MRILLSRSSTDKVIGGAELTISDIVASLLSSGNDCMLVTNIKDPRITRKVPFQSITHAIWPRFSNQPYVKIIYPFLLIVMYFQYLITVIKFQPDIINPQSREDQIILTSIGNILRIPVLWRDAGDLSPQLTRRTNGVFQKINRHIQIHSLRHATHITTLNEDEMAVILHCAPFLENRISIMQSNISFEDYDTSAHKLPAKSDKVIVIGTIIRLEEHKGVQYLIEAFINLQSTNENLELWIIGEGSYASTLKNLAVLRPNIHFLGKQNNVSKYLRSFDIFVQPSEFEGWGRNVREAMYFSLPVVGSEVGGIKKQITDGEDGILFPAKDSVYLQSKLDYLVKNPNIRQKLGLAASKTVRDGGDWNTTVRETLIPLLESFVIKK